MFTTAFALSGEDKKDSIPSGDPALASCGWRGASCRLREVCPEQRCWVEVVQVVEVVCPTAREVRSRP